MIKIPASITVDTNDNRYYWPAYKPAKLPAWIEMQSVNPMVMCKVVDIHEAIEAHRAWNQKRVNEILSEYY